MLTIKKSYIFLLYCSILASLCYFYFPYFGAYTTLLSLICSILVFLKTFTLYRVPTFFSIISIIILFNQLIAYAITWDNNSLWKLLSFYICASFFLCCIPNNKYNILVIEKILKIFVIVAFFSCVYAVIFQLRPDVFSFREGGYNIENKYPSIWGHRNVFAGVLLCGIFSQLYFIKIKKINSLKQNVKLIFMIANLIITLSRTAYVTIAAFYFLYYLMNYKRHKKEFFILSFIVIILLGSYIFLPNLKAFVDIYMIREESGLTGRNFVWELGINLLQGEHLLWGYGFGYSRIFLGNNDVTGSAGFHNMYLTYLVEGGIVLLCCYCLIVFYIVKEMCSTWLSKNRMVASFWLSVMFAYHVYYFFEASMPLNNSTYISFSITVLTLSFPLMYTKIKEI